MSETPLTQKGRAWLSRAFGKKATMNPAYRNMYALAGDIEAELASVRKERDEYRRLLQDLVDAVSARMCADEPTIQERAMLLKTWAAAVAGLPSRIKTEGSSVGDLVSATAELISSMPRFARLATDKSATEADK